MSDILVSYDLEIVRLRTALELASNSAVAAAEQCAAKDAEIAELRAALQRANDTIHSQSRLAQGAATETSRAERERDEALSKYNAVVDKYDAAVDKAIALAQERDEARKCVGRLWKFVREYESMLHNGHETTETLTELREVRAALAATPEHLR